MGFELRDASVSDFIKIERVITQAEIYTIGAVPVQVYTAIPGKALVLISAAFVNDLVTVPYNAPNEIGLRSGLVGPYSWGCEPNFPIFELGSVVNLAPFDINNGTVGGKYRFTENIFLVGSSNPISGAGSSKFIGYGFLVDV